MTTAGRGGTGMQNLGNTCYMNAAVQVLRHDPGLAAWASSRASTSAAGGNSVTAAFCAVVRKLALGDEQVVKPAALKNAIDAATPQFHGNMQQVAPLFTMPYCIIVCYFFFTVTKCYSLIIEWTPAGRPRVSSLSTRRNARGDQHSPAPPAVRCGVYVFFSTQC